MATAEIHIGAKVGKSYPLSIRNADGSTHSTKIRTAAAVRDLIRDALKHGASSVKVVQDGKVLTYQKVGKLIKAVSGGKGGRKAAAVHKVATRKTTFKRSTSGSSASAKAGAKKAAASKAKAPKAKAPKAEKAKKGKVNSGLAEFQAFVAAAKAEGKTHKQAQAAWKKLHPKKKEAKAEKPKKAEKTPSVAPVAAASTKGKARRRRVTASSEISGSLPSAAAVLGSAALKKLRKRHGHR